jgi:hypothetical protein
MTLPEIEEPQKIERVLEDWDPARRLFFCDEAAPSGSPVQALRDFEPGPAAVLIGPEGGFSAEERARILSRDFVTSLSLGPRILRADTAAVAALTLVQASSVIGDKRLCGGDRPDYGPASFYWETCVARDTADDTPIESRHQLAAYLESGCKPRDAWRIGTEHEKFRVLQGRAQPCSL